MTLTAEQSSNKAEYEAAPTAEIIDIIRTAMGEGCIRPCHVYDAVDELICRIQALENSPKRNCDVGTAKEQDARLWSYCAETRCGDTLCRNGNCSLEDIRMCALRWAQMPYEEGGEK